MRRRAEPIGAFLVLAAVLVVGAFQWGQASASARLAERRRTAVVEAVDHAAPAMVSVNAWRTQARTRSAGSGVIVNPAGFVVTNSHVIRGADRITVVPFRSREVVRARLIADDPRGDLAVLQVEGRRTWPYVSLAPTGDVILGESAIAIGNPRGLGDSITVGVVSAVRRSAKVASGGTIANLIQTDASINSGNSGGPLLNLDGELIGINTSILPSANGIAFAIPADDVGALLRRALGGAAPRNPLPPPTPERPAPVRPPVAACAPAEPSPGSPVGEEGEDLAVVPLRLQDIGLSVEDDGRRLLVQAVAPGSAADRAGLRAGDLLLEIDRLPTEALDDVELAFQASHPGRRYEIRVRRGQAPIDAILVAPR